MIRRTAAITAASIAGVIIAGGAAVGANIGILNAADNNSLGDLSAEAPITSSTNEPVFSAPSIVRAPASSDSSQSFDVDVAGTIEIESDDAGIRLGEVRTNQRWSWEDTTSDPETITVRFTSGTDTLEFTATSNDDGTIEATVGRPGVGSPTATNQATGSSDEYDDGGRDDHGEDDHGEDEHEGGADDD